MEPIVAGIVLYNPDIWRLKENVKAILPQVDILIIVDNGSVNFPEVKTEFSNKEYQGYKIEILANSENLGIAKALNQICELAKGFGATWVLTLDQDSVCFPNLIEEYRRYIDIDGVSSMTCLMKNRSKSFEFEKENFEEEYRFVDGAITSGNYISLAAWESVGRFDENLFIDKVDTDFSFRLALKNNKQIKINYMGLLHDIGDNAADHCLFGKRFVVFNHSPFRNYHLIRNQIYFARKYEKIKGKKWSRRIKRTSWTRIIVYLLYEDRKLQRIKAWCRGLWDGYSMKVDCLESETSLLTNETQG